MEGDVFKWLRSCMQEARDSVVFCTRLELHGFSQPPTLMWLSHKLSLLCTVTYLYITVVANSLSRIEFMFKRMLTVVELVDGACCMADLPFQLCIRSNSGSYYRYLSQRSFLWEFLRIIFCFPEL